MHHLHEIIAVRARIKYWAARGNNYANFVARIQKMSNKELKAELERYACAWPKASFKRLFQEIALVKTYPPEYLTWVLTIQAKSEAEIDELINFFSGVQTLTSFRDAQLLLTCPPPREKI